MKSPPAELASTIELTQSSRQRLQDARPVPSRVALLLYHRDGVEAVPLLPGPGVIVGRASPADVVISDPSLSRTHARFILEEGAVIVEDLSSKNGTYIGKLRISREVLPADGEVQMGAVTATIQQSVPADTLSLGLESHDSFRNALQLETVRARYFSRNFVIVIARTAKHRDGHLRNWEPRVRALLRPVDRVALYSSDTIELLLPETSADEACKLARAIVEGREREPPLVCGVAQYPGAATTAEQLLEVALDAARSATVRESVRIANTENTRSLVSSLRVQKKEEAGATVGDAPEMIANSPVMQALLRDVKRVASTSIPVLLLGETGTGKEVIARLIHESSPRRDKPLISVNCGAIPENLIESALFGHERGAFSGAIEQRKGLFEAASSGTLLLDEIGELPLPAQAALLRVLETKRVTRVGSTKEIPVDCRIIAATHRDLDAMCQAGKFRQDLLFRIEIATLKLAPLRMRREDILPLIETFLAQANSANDCQVQGIEPPALTVLMRYSWPGNVRELRNALERAVVIAEGDVITIADLPERVRRSGASSAAQDDPEMEDDGLVTFASNLSSAHEDEGITAQSGGLKQRLLKVEMDAIREAMVDANWSQAEAAKRLGLPLRTLQYKIKALGIRKPARGDG